MKLKNLFLYSLIFLLPALSGCDLSDLVSEPVADFSADKTQIVQGETIQFTDLSLGVPTEWAWTFEGGTPTLSADENPTVTYETPGTYSVSLTVTNSSGADVAQKMQYITVTSLSPIADFNAEKTTITVGESITFSDLSQNSPTDWTWTFQGGTPTFSTDENPTVQYNTSGVYSVSLTAENMFGSDTKQKTDYITVLEKPVTITFQNNLYTNFQVSVDGVTKDMTAGGEVVFEVNANTNIDYYAETYGQTDDGGKIGEKVSWTYTVNVLEEDIIRVLDIGPNYFFLFLQNVGGELADLYVNYDLESQTYDDILIPSDNVKYKIGYYQAFNNGNVRMYFTDNKDEHVQWNQGEHYTLPNAENQKIELVNDVAKKASKTNAQNITEKKQYKRKLLPMKNIEMVKISPNGVTDLPNKK